MWLFLPTMHTHATPTPITRTHTHARSLERHAADSGSVIILDEFATDSHSLFISRRLDTAALPPLFSGKTCGLHTAMALWHTGGVSRGAQGSTQPPNGDEISEEREKGAAS